MLEDDLERAEEKLSSITSKLSTAETEKDEADRAVQRSVFPLLEKSTIECF
jgi:hypothetical protein